MDLLELSSRPASYKFNEEEIAFIKSKVSRLNFEAKYCIYKKESKKNMYIGFIVDQMPFQYRRSAIMNNWKVICARPLHTLEYEEMIENFGCNNRRFYVYMYRDIEVLIKDDLKYGIKTPEEFINKCKALGYSGQYQLKLF